MSLDDYVNRHKRVELDLKVATNKTNKVAAKHLLLGLDVIADGSKSIAETKADLQNIFTTMYTKDVYESIVMFGEDMIAGSVKWESEMHDIVPNDYDMLLISLFGKVLIDKNTLKGWLLRASYNDVERIMKIVGKSTVNEVSQRRLRSRVVSSYKGPLNNIRKLMDAVAFSSVFLVRDKVLKMNKVELMQWISILDSGTTPGCVARDELLYKVKNNEPYKHFTSWKMPGVYHWGCRSFVIPHES